MQSFLLDAGNNIPMEEERFSKPEDATELAGQGLLPCSALMNGQGCGIEFFLKSTTGRFNEKRLI